MDYPSLSWCLFIISLQPPKLGYMCVLPFPHNKQRDQGEKGSFFFVPLSSVSPAWGPREGGNEWVSTPYVRLPYFYMSNTVRVTSLPPLSSWWCKGSKFKVTWLVKDRGIILTQLCGSYTDRLLKDLVFVWCVCVYICVPEYVYHRTNVEVLGVGSNVWQAVLPAEPSC